MSKLKAVRKRILGVRSTRKITRAMQMVAAVQMRKAKDEADRQVLYLERVASTLGMALRGPSPKDPLLDPSGGRVPRACIVVAGERGLCGGFNASLFRFMDQHLEGDDPGPEAVFVWGRKGEEHFASHPKRLAWPAGPRPSHDLGAAWIRRQVVDLVREGRFGSFDLVYNRFVNPTLQRPAVEPLVPVPVTASDGEAPILEPDRETVLREVAIQHLEAAIDHALLETRAGEFSARMTAMDNATKNADEMIDQLTLKYNQARQGAITREILEVVAGAEAMTKG